MAKTQEDDQYVCSLDEASLQVAIQELNENPADRLGSVQKFREWIINQPHLKCPTDTEFLLRFLRAAKFSQLRAREILEGYFTNKTELPQWYNDIDTHNKKIIAFLKTGFFLPLGFNKKNQFIFMVREGCLDPSGKAPYTKDDIWNAVFAVILYHMGMEKAMVNGYIYIVDMSSFEMKHLNFWGMDVIKKSWKIFQKNFPGRFKGFHYYNCGPAFETVMAMSRPLISKKMKDRISTHDNLEKIYDLVSMEHMPEEYLPDDYNGPNAGSVDDIINGLINDLGRPEIRARILYESKKEWGVDLSKKSSDVPEGSFRKLNVD